MTILHTHGNHSQGGESDHVTCKNVLCCMQDKTSPIKVNGGEDFDIFDLIHFIQLTRVDF